MRLELDARVILSNAGGLLLDIDLDNGLQFLLIVEVREVKREEM